MTFDPSFFAADNDMTAFGGMLDDIMTDMRM
jgi:hypothetical protein